MKNDSEPAAHHEQTANKTIPETILRGDESSDVNAGCHCKNGQPTKKHPLEWAIALMVFGTLIATGFAAHYTKKQWQTAADSENRQVRAYVFLRDVRLEKRNGDVFDFIPEWENTGASETRNMKSFVNFFFARFGFPDWFSFGDIGKDSTPNLLGPKSVSNVSYTSVSKTCIDKFNRREGLQKFYVWGWARAFHVLIEAYPAFRK